MPGSVRSFSIPHIVSQIPELGVESTAKKKREEIHGTDKSGNKKYYLELPFGEFTNRLFIPRLSNAYPGWFHVHTHSANL